MNTARKVASLELKRAEDRILDALRFARTGTTAPQRKGYVRNLCADMLSRPRVTPVRQILSVLHDSFERGATEAHLLAVSDQLRREIALWYRQQEQPTDFDTAHVAEEKAEGEADVAEAVFGQRKDFPSLQALEHAHRVHVTTANNQIKAARMTLGLLS